jgi:SAM-dependent methyltransferase
MLIRRRFPLARRLLDVACGTGQHLARLQADFDVTGLELDEGLVQVARQRLADVPIRVGDMAAFDLGETYDVVVCLFSSIAYTRTIDRLRTAVSCMARHLHPEGLLIVEPWFTPDRMVPGSLGLAVVDRADLKVARINGPIRTVDGIDVIDFHYVIADRTGVRYLTERHEIGAFTHEDYREALDRAGLDVEYDPEGLIGRGLYVGQVRAR